MVGFNHSMNYQLEESDFETVKILQLIGLTTVGFLDRMAEKFQVDSFPTKKSSGFRTNPNSKNHKSIKFAWIVVTMLGSEIPCEGDEGEEIFRCKGCKYELIQQLDSEEIPWKSLKKNDLEMICFQKNPLEICRLWRNVLLERMLVKRPRLSGALWEMILRPLRTSQPVDRFDDLHVGFTSSEFALRMHTFFFPFFFFWGTFFISIFCWRIR